MFKKSVMVVGAGPNQIPVIRAAVERGFDVIATDMDPDAAGFPLCLEHGIVSIRDVKGTVKFASEIHERLPLSGVVTMASESAVTVYTVARELGLPGLDPETAWLATNKVARQKAFFKAMVPSPRFAQATSSSEAILESEKIGWPVVLKPADSAGSRGVQLVPGPDDMEKAVTEIKSITRVEEFLIEEFLEGTEHSIEGVVIDGQVHWTGFSDRNYDNKHIYPPYFLEDGDTLPTILAPETLEAAQHASTAAVQALGIDWGPVKGDILIDRDGPKILEMAARLSGDYFCYETVPLHNGINLLEIVLDLSLGEKIDPVRFQEKFHRGVALRYLWPKPGRVVKITGVQEVQEMEGVHFFRWEPRWEGIGVGTVITPARSMGERLGSVMAVGKTREEAIKRAEKAINKIHIETE